MIWFDGSIRKAVDKVKSSDAFLLVFVQGNDSLSEKYEAYLNEKAVIKVEECVAIKIPHDSAVLQQFKQIYVSVPVPSVFLIQSNGIPLKVVSSSNTSDIHIAINDALNKQKHRQEKKQKVLSNNGKIFNNNTKNNGNTSAELSHVKNIGRKILDVTEDELKTRLKEIRAFPKFLQIDNPSPSDLLCRSKSLSKTQSARIQFRLPDNSTPSWEFPELATLSDLKAYLIEKMKLSPNFKFFRAYPRCVFTVEDERKTLSALSLTPSAILIVVPFEDKTVQAKVTDLSVHQNFISTVMNMLLKPLFSLLGFFKKHIWRTQTINKNVGKFSTVTINKNTSMKRSNIHGFKFDEDTDTDTEHPDNGNSTQQRFQ